MEKGIRIIETYVNKAEQIDLYDKYLNHRDAYMRGSIELSL